MNHALDIIKNIPVADPQTVLRALAEYAQKYGPANDDPVKAVVLLRTGQTISGIVARFARDQKGEYVLLQEADEKINPYICFIRLDDVIGLQISSLSRALEALQGQSQTQVLGDAPTRLELKRQVEQLNQGLKEKGIKLTMEGDWNTFGESADERLCAKQLFLSAHTVLLNIDKQTIGKDALKQISSVVVAGSGDSQIRAERADRVLRIHYDLRRPVPKTLETDLLKQVEAAL